MPSIGVENIGDRHPVLAPAVIPSAYNRCLHIQRSTIELSLHVLNDPTSTPITSGFVFYEQLLPYNLAFCAQ